MESLLGNRTRRADLTFYRSGRINITSRIAKALGLRDGDVIDIGYERGEYYLYCAAKADTLVGRHEAQCHSTHKGRLHPSNNLCCHSKRITDAMLKVCRAGECARIWAGEFCELGRLGKAVVIIPASNSLINP